jgi:hypothetical protein
VEKLAKALLGGDQEALGCLHSGIRDHVWTPLLPQRRGDPPTDLRLETVKCRDCGSLLYEVQTCLLTGEEVRRDFFDSTYEALCTRRGRLELLRALLVGLGVDGVEDLWGGDR